MNTTYLNNLGNYDRTCVVWDHWDQNSTKQETLKQQGYENYTLA